MNDVWSNSFWQNARYILINPPPDPRVLVLQYEPGIKGCLTVQILFIPFYTIINGPYTQ